MKQLRLIAAIAAIVIGCSAKASAKSIPADSLSNYSRIARFYEGCSKIMIAEAESDSLAKNAAYTAAMDLMNPRDRRSRPGLKTSQMVISIADSTGIANDNKLIGFAYSYAYAKARAKMNDFSASGVTRGLGDNSCRVTDLVVKPHAVVDCSENVRGDCLLIAIANPGAQIALRVEDGANLMEATPYDNATTQMMHWRSAEEFHPVRYLIENLTDEAVTVTLIGN